VPERSARGAVASAVAGLAPQEEGSAPWVLCLDDTPVCGALALDVGLPAPPKPGYLPSLVETQVARIHARETARATTPPSVAPRPRKRRRANTPSAPPLQQGAALWVSRDSSSAWRMLECALIQDEWSDAVVEPGPLALTSFNSVS
jgi:hypothetical protein